MRISSTHNISRVSEIIKAFLKDNFANVSLVILKVKESNLFEVVSKNSFGMPVRSTINPSKKGIIGYVAKTKRELTVCEIENEARIFEGKRQPKSLFILPIIRMHKIIGVVAFGCKNPKKWTEQEMRKLRQLRDALTISLSYTILLREKRKCTKLISDLGQYINSIINGLPSGIITIDKNGNITLINKRAQQILGFEEKIAKKTTIKKLFETKKATANPLLETLTLEKPLVRVETNIFENNGSKTPIGFSTALLKDDSGKVIGAIGIMRELTEIKQMEKRMRRQDRLVALGEMAAGMAHEIRNPLAGIKTGVQYLGRFLDEEKKDSVKLIVQEIDRLNRIVTDMTQYSNRPPIKLDTAPLQDIIELSLSFLKNKIEEKGIKIIKKMKKNIPPVRVDCDQIREVFDNIILNAIQASDINGTIRLSITHLKKANMIETIVKDTGSGISTNDKEKIFNPFFTTKSGGTGLGLSITHRIISEHNGYISISSKQGQDTTVKIGLSTKL